MLRSAFALVFGLQVLAAGMTTAALLPFRGSVTAAGGAALPGVLIGLTLAQGVLATAVHARAARAAARGRRARPSRAGDDGTADREPAPRIGTGRAAPEAGERSQREGAGQRDPDRRAARTAALAASLLGAALLASPAWFAGFAWLAGVPVTLAASLVALLALYYLIGASQQSALARRLAGGGAR